MRAAGFFILKPDEFALAAALRFGKLIVSRSHNELDAATISASVREHLVTAIANCMQQSYSGHSYVTVKNKDCLDALSHLTDCFLVDQTSSNQSQLHPTRLQLSPLQPISLQPLVLWRNRLYLARYWSAEARLALSIKSWLNLDPLDVDFVNTHHAHAHAQMQVDRYLPLDSNGFNASQREAVLHCLLQQFTVIAGGPGTGKTTTVKALLNSFYETQQANGVADTKLALVAPTGKAANRLLQSIEALDSASLSSPIQVSTIHKLIGKRVDGSVLFDKANPLNLDLLIVDEASMLDVLLADQLISALPPRCKVVLLGDANQLSAVETGAFFHDLCLPKLERSEKWLCKLRHTFRFSADSVVAKASSALEASADEDFVSLIKPRPLGTGSQAIATLTSGYDSYVSFVKKCQSSGEPFEQIKELFEALNRYRVLVAINEGRSGQRHLSTAIDEAIRTALNIKDELIEEQAWYEGQAILFLKNDSILGVSNGDAAIIWKEVRPPIGEDVVANDESQRWVAILADGRRFSASLIQHYTSAWVITVHKAQGSEYEHVAFVLPPRPVDKSLLYTALTRSTRHFTAFGRVDDYRHSVLTSSARQTSIIERLFSTK